MNDLLHRLSLVGVSLAASGRENDAKAVTEAIEALETKRDERVTLAAQAIANAALNGVDNPLVYADAEQLARVVINALDHAEGKS